MTTKCKECGSFAINHNCHGRDGSDSDLCDVCYWRKRAGDLNSFRLPCNVLLEPGVRFCKGVSVSTLILGIRNRESYEIELAAMSDGERNERDRLIREFKELFGLQGGAA